MNKVEQYLAHADECHRMAKSAGNSEHRAALLKMAQTWTDLASAREEEIERATCVGSRRGNRTGKKNRGS
jgi:hypothetical protein